MLSFSSDTWSQRHPKQPSEPRDMHLPKVKDHKTHFPFVTALKELLGHRSRFNGNGAEEHKSSFASLVAKAEAQHGLFSSNLSSRLKNQQDLPCLLVVA